MYVVIVLLLLDGFIVWFKDICALERWVVMCVCGCLRVSTLHSLDDSLLLSGLYAETWWKWKKWSRPRSDRFPDTKDGVCAESFQWAATLQMDKNKSVQTDIWTAMVTTSVVNNDPLIYYCVCIDRLRRLSIVPVYKPLVGSTRID